MLRNFVKKIVCGYIVINVAWRFYEGDTPKDHHQDDHLKIITSSIAIIMLQNNGCDLNVLCYNKKYTKYQEGVTLCSLT